MNQLTLFEMEPTVAVESSEDASIRARFESFDKQNPHVFEALRRICLDRRLRGMRQWSIKAAWEEIRWYNALKTNGATVKLCNDLHAHYSRKLMQEVPELEGFFETRPLRERNYDNATS